MGVSVAIISAVSLPVIEHYKIVTSSYTSKQSFYTAEALNEDILYRLNHGVNISSTESLTINGATANADISNISGGKEITILSEKDSYERSLLSRVTNAVGVSFNYGMQVGTGGIVMANNASVIGNVYANGNISGGSVTGTVIAANSAAQFSDQSNIGSTTPTQSIVFRNASGSQDFAQSFQVSTTSHVQKIQLYIKKVGTPSNATVRIVSNSGSSPSSTNLLTTQGTLSASLVTTSYGWVDIVLPSTAQLNAGTTYWFVIDNSTQSTSNYYELAANTQYSSGNAKVGAFSGTWNNTSPAGLDAYFSLYLGGAYATISGVTIGSDAWAHTITGGTVSGTKYCQVGTGCNTSREDPAPQGYPVSDANITKWKEDASAGGTLSSFTATSSSRLGPKKITGNLTIPNNGTLYLDGAVWVAGSITINNGATVRLSSSYGNSSGILLSDGKVIIGNNSSFIGSGQSGSYIMVLTTSDCPTSPSCSGGNAIELSNNAGAVILNAQNGTLNINNNGGTKEAVAKTILMGNGATVTYESGLSDLNFSSGPSGSFSIDSWQEIE